MCIRDSCNAAASGVATRGAWIIVTGEPCVLCAKLIHHAGICLLYTSDAADERSSVDLGGRRIIKKKKKNNIREVHNL